MNTLFGPMLLWIPIVFTILAVVLWTKGGRKKATRTIHNGTESHQKEDIAHTEKEHKKSSHKDSHTGEHESHHHHTPFWKKVMGIVITFALICLGLLAFMWLFNELFGPFGVAPGASSERRYELSQTHGAKRPVIVSAEWHRIIAPPKGDLWSTWIDIPPGHTIYFCDMVRDPSCSARSFDDVEFIPQCRSLIDGSPLDWNDVSCRYTDANRVQAKGSKAMLVHYRFAPAP